MQALLSRGVIQAKLTVSQPGDPHELEAERVADAVVHAPEPSPVAGPPSAPTPQPAQVQRLCAECEEELHRQPAPGAAPALGGTATPSVLPLGEGGHPLPGPVRSFFEPRFGRDFSQVRIHTGGVAAESARSVGALAYAFGDHLVFGAGQFRPETEAGRKLLAHELTHTLQQPARDQEPLLQRQADDEEGSVASAESEEEAAAVAEEGFSEAEEVPADDTASLDTMAAEPSVASDSDAAPGDQVEGKTGCSPSSGRLDYPRGIRNRDSVSIRVGQGCSTVTVRLTAHWECVGCAPVTDTYRVTLDGVPRTMRTGNQGIEDECPGTPEQTSTATFQVRPGTRTLTITAGAGNDFDCRLVLRGYYRIT
ncbi:MAG: DUF4157 domain-containing protein [Thermoanaerobaculia bacterium]